MPTLDVWYAQLDVDDDREAPDDDRLGAHERAQRPARRRSSWRRRDARQPAGRLGKLTRVVDGRLAFVAQPPLVVPLEDLLARATSGERVGASCADLAHGYRRSLPTDRRGLLEQYRFVDMARKVVGVGSVGTRCWIVLLIGRDDDDPLFLQAKEAQPSVLEPYLEPQPYANDGRARRRRPAAHAGRERHLPRLAARPTGIDGGDRDFYVRQLRDWKGSVDIDADGARRGCASTRELCGWTLARAHARSGDRVAIAAYLGSSDGFDQALVASSPRRTRTRTSATTPRWSAAVAEGRLQATTGVVRGRPPPGPEAAYQRTSRPSSRDRLTASRREDTRSLR